MTTSPTPASPTSVQLDAATDSDLMREIADLRRLLARQQVRIDALELGGDAPPVIGRLPMTSVPAPSPLPVQSDAGNAIEGSGLRSEESSGRLGRRQLLRRVGGLTAGATVGGLALAMADQTPAAAATLFASGNPGIVANGIGGHGVDAITNTSGSAALHGTASATGAFGLLARRDFGMGYAAGITNQVEGGQALIVTGYQNNPLAEFQNNGATADNATIGLMVTNTRGHAASLAGRVQLHLNPIGLSPKDGRPGPFVGGSVVADVNGDLWFCAGDGSPESWRKMSGPATAGQFHILAATNRVYDSRPGNLPNIGSKTRIDGTTDRVISTNKGNVGGALTAAVPAGASAALVNLTIVNTSASGFLGLYKNGITWPGNSSINWSATGTVLANSAIVALDDVVQFKVKCSSGSSTDMIVDVIGYYL